MLEEYLNNRKQIILDRIKEYSELLEHNKIKKEEAYSKIDELNSLIDEASEIFSSKARIDSEHKNSEVNKIKENIELIECESNNLKLKLAKASKELVDIQNSINEFKSDYVSRETKYKRRRPTIKREVIDKLKLCKDIISVDSKRVAIELDEIIKLLS